MAITMPRQMLGRMTAIASTLGMLMCLTLLMSLMGVEKTRNFFLVYMAAGFLVYFLFGLWNSKLGRGLATAPDALAGMEAPAPEP